MTTETFALLVGVLVSLVLKYAPILAPKFSTLASGYKVLIVCLLSLAYGGAQVYLGAETAGALEQVLLVLIGSQTSYTMTRNL